MWFRLLTVFPGLLSAVRDYGVVGRAVRGGLIDLEAIDLRDFAVDRHGSVDDRPYGGGAGMLLRLEPLLAAIDAAHSQFAASQAAPESAAAGAKPLVVAMTPQGKRLDQRLVEQLGAAPGLILLCGRYEGFDQRLLEHAVDLEVSMGDYVLSGGELPALTLVDAISRLQPGVLGNSASPIDESHLEALLDFPQYTRPENHPAGPVPEALRSGDHARISRWRRQQALLTTFWRRPDLLAGKTLSASDRALLKQALLEQDQQPTTRTGPSEPGHTQE